MVSIVDSRREILLSPLGTNVWSGQIVQGLNGSAVTWSLAKQLYSSERPYFIVPLGLVIGMVPTLVQWLLWKGSATLNLVKTLALNPNLEVSEDWTYRPWEHHTSHYLYGTRSG